MFVYKLFSSVYYSSLFSLAFLTNIYGVVYWETTLSVTADSEATFETVDVCDCDRVVKDYNCNNNLSYWP